MNSNSWLVRQRHKCPHLRLYCFPHAGGDAARFLPWQTAIGAEIEVCGVQLPGHGTRLIERACDSLPVLVDMLADVILSESAVPFAFFGHSLGGLLAFELARYCYSQGLPRPVHLFPSGCDAPRHPRQARHLHQLPADAFISELKDYNGTPPEVLINHEIMELLIPTLRAEFALAETYEYRASSPLEMPITVLAGKLDDQICSEQVTGWQKETTNKCRVMWFEGGHFFINENRKAVLNFLREELAPYNVYGVRLGTRRCSHLEDRHA